MYKSLLQQFDTTVQWKRTSGSSNERIWSLDSSWLLIKTTTKKKRELVTQEVNPTRYLIREGLLSCSNERACRWKICGSISVSQNIQTIVTPHFHASSLSVLDVERAGGWSDFWAPSTTYLTWAVHLSHSTGHTATFVPSASEPKLSVSFSTGSGWEDKRLPCFSPPKRPLPTALRQSVTYQGAARGSRRQAREADGNPPVTQPD